MGAGTSQAGDESQRHGSLATRTQAVVALTPRTQASSTMADVRDFVRKQRHSKEQLWAEIQAQYEKEPATPNTETASNLDEEDEVHTLCPECKKDSLYQSLCCRVCAVCYHSKCLIKAQHATEEQIAKFEANALGWSCPKCDSIYKLLTPDELTEIREHFDAVDTNNDRHVSLEEYLTYARGRFKAAEDRAMTDMEESYERFQFRRLDTDGNGHIDFPEFVKFNTGRYLSRRSKEELVKYLTRREIKSARGMFTMLDKDKDGTLTSVELHVVYQGWYKAIKQKGLEGLSSDIVDRRVEMVMEADMDKDRVVTWEEYLKNQALYILASRPNGSNYHGPYVAT